MGTQKGSSPTALSAVAPKKPSLELGDREGDALHQRTLGYQVEELQFSSEVTSVCLFRNGQPQGLWMQWWDTGTWLRVEGWMSSAMVTFPC